MAPAYALSFEAGEVITTGSAHTFIDGVACRQPDPVAFAAMRKGVSHFVRVSDDETAAAMRLMFRTTHQLPCPSGACALAALTQEKQCWQGRRVGVVMTSSNVDTEVAAAVLSGVGGVLGIVLAMAVGFVMTLVVTTFSAIPPAWAVAAGLIAAIGVGVVAGYWPARRAARLDPVQALRYE